MVIRVLPLLLLLAAPASPVGTAHAASITLEPVADNTLFEDILGVQVRKVVIAVDAGRNLAVLVEAAVRNSILQLRGIDTYGEFVRRHQQAMEGPQSDS